MRIASVRATVATATLIASLGTAEAAWACNDPFVSVSPSVVRPGDTIQWTIGNAEPRARYSVTVAGRPAGSGEVGASEPRGTYVIPDLGSSPRTIHVYMTHTHDEASPTHEEGSYRPEPDSYALQYEPAVAPAPHQPAPPAAPPSEPGATPGKVRPQATEEPAAKQPDSGRRADPPAASKPAPRNSAPTEPALRNPAPVQTSMPVAEQQLPERPGVVADASARAPERAASTAKPRRDDAAAPRALPGPQPSRRLPLVHATPRAVPAVGDGAAAPATLVVVLSLSVVVAVGAVAIWALRRRGFPLRSRLAGDGPPWVPPGLGAEPRDLLIEAELQELIAEERARHVEREAAHIRSGPG